MTRSWLCGRARKKCRDASTPVEEVNVMISCVDQNVGVSRQLTRCANRAAYCYALW